MLILREICKRISLNPIPTQTIDFSLVNISQKTTSFARTRSGTKNSLKQKRGPFNSSPFSNNPFAKTNASTVTPIDRSSPFFFHANWLNITRDQFILNAVQGFKICFRCTPVQSVVPRVSDQNSIIKNEIVSLLKKGAIRQVPFSHDGFYHRLFLVPKKGGGQRPVLDFSALNQFIETEHFKMENLVTLKSLLNKGDYMINLDLTDAYLTVPMHPDSRKFLRFLLGDKTYEFTAMPFGLNVAPRLFTKIMKPVVASLRSQGVRLIIYLDDILIIASTFRLKR